MERKGRGRSPAESGCMRATVSRRSLMVGGSVILASMGIAGRSEGAGTPPDRMALQRGDRIQIIKGDLKDQLVQPDLLKAGDPPVEAYPVDPAGGGPRRKNRLNRLLALRLDPAEMDEETRERSVAGVVVYSALCTHRNCTIQSWMPEERYLRCPCHLSQFAALSAGSVMSGPARRQLPMVPVGVDGEGFVIATDGFTRPPGGEQA